MSKQNQNYFSLGLFVLIGVAILVALTLIFGAGNFNKKTVILETYVTGSVTGLEVGAPVRFRGVKIGVVKEISLSGSLYEQHKPLASQKQYVVIRIEVLERDHLEEDIEKLVTRNLRAQVKPAGITGVQYVEFDSSPESQKYPVLVYDWDPKYPVVPSLPSQTDMVIQGLQKALSMTEQIDLKDSQDKLNTLLTNLNKIVMGDGKDHQGLEKSIRDLDKLVNNLNQVASNKDLNALVSQSTYAAAAVRQKLGSIEGDSQLTMEQIKQAAEQANDLSGHLARNPSSVVLGAPPKRIQLPEVKAP
jgi:ABC-type transporter Mla subunit MlaD